MRSFLYLLFLPLLFFVFSSIARASGENYLELEVQEIEEFVDLSTAELEELFKAGERLIYLGTYQTIHIVFIDRTDRESDGMPWTFFEKRKIPTRDLHVDPAWPITFQNGIFGVSPYIDGLRLLGLKQIPSVILESRK